MIEEYLDELRDVCSFSVFNKFTIFGKIILFILIFLGFYCITILFSILFFIELIIKILKHFLIKKDY